MAVVQQKLPLQSARQRRAQIPQSYFKLGDSGLIAGAVAIVCLLSILFLAQTGRVATAGYELQELQNEHVQLIHQAEQYQFEIAQASRLDVITDRATKIGLRPATAEQRRYTTVEIQSVPVVAANNR